MCRRVVEEGWSLTEAAEAAGVSERSCATWVGRFRAEGEAALVGRSSAPKTVANRTDERRVAAIAALRRLRMTGAEIAQCLDMALSTVSGVLTRVGLGKLSRLEPPEPANRYERKRPGELIRGLGNNGTKSHASVDALDGPGAQSWSVAFRSIGGAPARSRGLWGVLGC